MLDSNRFAFGQNWARLLKHIDDSRIQRAEESLQKMLGKSRLDGLRFLDIGSGSGLFSLAARRLGATVHSFDYDVDSVQCTATLKARYFPEDENWKVEQGSVLDKDYLSKLPQSDIVYSWGVLHHTGNLWEAMENAISKVLPHGIFFISIYNDQGKTSKRWTSLKRLYNQTNSLGKTTVLLPSFAMLWGPTLIRDTLKGKPLSHWKNYREDRGMSPWRDVVDWVGGYPFEVAKPEQILDFSRNHGFTLTKMKTCGGGIGCNEFVFERHQPKT